LSETIVATWDALDAQVGAFAARPHSSLDTLRIAIANFADLMSRGEISPHAFEHGPAISSPSFAAVATATPHLRELALDGIRLMTGISHPALERLVLCGDPIDGCPFSADAPAEVAPVIALPRLVRVEHIALLDEYLPFATRSILLDPSSCPALRELVLRGPYMHNVDETPFQVIGASPILPQLTCVMFPQLDAGLDANYLDTFAERYRHLEQFEVGELTIDETEENADNFEARVRQALPNLKIGRVTRV
jgi:hypothetical protein